MRCAKDSPAVRGRHSHSCSDRSASDEACYSPSCSGATGVLARPPPTFKPMPYRVKSFTMAQVRQGSLAWHRQLSAVLREYPGIKVYSASPFDLDERRRQKDRFGGDVVYFFNPAACEAIEQMGLALEFQAEIPEAELPRRRSLVVGLPERKGGAVT
jgi:hypothetical protein